MLIIPAIDIMDGKVVRLRQGTEATARIYFNNPVEVALHFKNSGAKWIHIVDLDGAFGRFEKNDSIIKEIVKSQNVSVELGGGIRGLDRIQFWLDSGIGRVILGSAAVEKSKSVEKAIQTWGPEKVIVSIDARDGKVATHGWTKASSKDTNDLAVQLANMGLKRTIVTDIGTDGMLTGPKLDTMLSIYRNTGLKIIASGGVSGMHDLVEISKHSDAIEGAIVGRAIYEKRFALKEAIDQFQEI